MARLVKTCDPEVYRLAADFVREYFERDVPDKDVSQLAMAVQQTLEDWIEEYAAELAAYENDPHERAAARARANDFEDTNGKDWT